MLNALIGEMQINETEIHMFSDQIDRDQNVWLDCTGKGEGAQCWRRRAFQVEGNWRSREMEMGKVGPAH